MPSEIPAGWYLDPANAEQERWWDGAGWTGHTQVPTTREDVATVNDAPEARDGTQTIPTDDDDGPSDDDAVAPRRRLTRRVVGVGLLALLVMLGSALGTIELLQMRDSVSEASAEPNSGPASDADPRDEAPSANESAGTPGEDLPTDAETSPDQGEAQESSDAAEEPATPRMTTVTLDGECTLTLDETTIAQSDRIRPWDYPDCEWAPVVLPPGGERWIVVLASLNSADFGPRDARARAQELGVSGAVLWSTHYPSLNPDLWVVFDGPFSSEAAAASAARNWGAAAYPRVLSDNTGDRYCLSPDGCVGERAN